MSQTPATLTRKQMAQRKVAKAAKNAALRVQLLAFIRANPGSYPGACVRAMPDLDHPIFKGLVNEGLIRFEYEDSLSYRYYPV